MPKKIIFRDEISQYPNRYSLTDLGGGLYELAPSSGAISQDGTLLNADNLNAVADEVIFKLKDTSTSSIAYTASLDGISTYFEGLTILFKPANTNTGSATINVNGVGAVAIKKTNNTGNIVNLEANDLIKNKYSTMTFDGTQFLMNNPSSDLAQVISDITAIENRLTTDETSINTLKQQVVRFAVTTGSNNNYAISLQDVTNYYSGMELNIVPNFNNTGISTLKINNLDVKNIKFDGSDLKAGDLKVNKIYKLIYDGINFELQVNPNLFNSHLAENATETQKGHIQLATQAEVTAGTDTNKAVTSKNLKTELDKKIDKSIITATGDIPVGTGNATLGKIAKGTVGQTLGVKDDGSVGYIDTGGWAKIARIDITANTSEVNITNIPTKYNKLRLVIMDVMNTRTSETISLFVRFNGDTIRDNYVGFPGVGTAGGNVSAGQVGFVSTTVATRVIIDIINETSKVKRMFGYGSNFSWDTHYWNNTVTKITAIQFFNLWANEYYTAGGIFELYGLE